MTYLLAAILAVEGWLGPGTFGTNGERGPYQITRACWQDANMPTGTFEDCDFPSYAQQVMLRYWKRYCPEALKNKDLAKLAAVHHFGPTGKPGKMAVKDTYVERVMNLVKDRQSSRH